MGKALLIKSSAGEKESTQGNWHLFEQATPYIQGIETGDLIENLDAEVLNSMISGLPSVWSRARIFGYAFKYTQKDANISTSGLIKFYESLVTEWKGLIALMALFPDRITLSEPVLLEAANFTEMYDISNSFGRMLFEDIDLWCDPNAVRTAKKEEPFIQLIYYKNILVGATSPYSLVFTAINYTEFPDLNEVPWYRNGKFSDPIEFGNLNNDQIQKLFLLVKNLADKLPAFEEILQLNRNGKEKLNLSTLYVFLQQWRDKLKATGNNLVDEGALDAELVFLPPFTPLFRIKQDLYLNNGIFSFEAPGEVVELGKILLQDDFIYSFNEIDEQQPMDEAAVYFLKALDPDNASKKWYFPIPLSAYGLKLFKNQIGDLLSAGTDQRHELRATFNPRNYRVTIEFFLSVAGKKQTPIVKEYEVKLITGAQRNVIMWPNFISKDWNAYYLYSEYPSNSRDIKLVPFFKDYAEMGGYEGGGYIVDHKNELIYIDSENRVSDLQVNRLVRYPVEIATSDDHAYEIVRSNKPFGGLEIRSLINGKDRVCGYLIVKKPNDESMGDKKIPDYSFETNFDDVVVGVDFGSNNSCFSYSKKNEAAVLPIPFTNRRMFLLGAEILDPNKEKTAQRNELLFFQNEEPKNGQIKSWVHDHNHRYIPSGMEQEEIAGGVPIFEHNLVIHKMNDRTIETNAGTLHHSMKWLTDVKGKEKKEAYLRTVWLKACADLYARRLRPAELRWSHPGAFSQFDITQYQLMYDDLAKVPISNANVQVSYTPSTEAEAVCNYALTEVGLRGSNIMLGIDVGGSTSDILIVAMDRRARAFRMVKQSSLRMAAGILSSVITKSDSIRRAIFKYHESPACPFKVANIKNIVDNPATAPFYFNAILDRLGDEDFKGFYSALGKTNPEIFALPAYITGLLLFYSGKLVAKAVKENDYSAIKLVDFMPFGKGGRIFDWLDTYPGKRLSIQYYTDCFRAGYGVGGETMQFEKRDNIRKDNKSEVSKGLSAPQKVTVDAEVRTNSDIIGEEGYMYYPPNPDEQPVDLNPDTNVGAHHLEEMDFGIEMPDRFVEFEKFLNIYLDFVGPRKSGIVKNTVTIEAKKTELVRELKGYILNDSEWQKADKQKAEGQPFEYKNSLLVLEGICFLEKFIVPEVYK